MGSKQYEYGTNSQTSGRILKVDSSFADMLEFSVTNFKHELSCMLDLEQAKRLHEQIAVWIGMQIA